LIHTVTELWCVGKDAGIILITIAGESRCSEGLKASGDRVAPPHTISITIDIIAEECESIVHSGITVIVDAITHFDGTGIAIIVIRSTIESVGTAITIYVRRRRRSLRLDNRGLRGCHRRRQLG
jgi:hypothetical protein